METYKKLKQKSIKCWRATIADGRINLTIRYGSKAIESPKGKNSIELANEEQIASTLLKAVQAGEFDELITQQQGKRGIAKNPK